MFWLPFEIFWAAAKHFILPYGIGGVIIAAKLAQAAPK